MRDVLCRTASNGSRFKGGPTAGLALIGDPEKNFPQKIFRVIMRDGVIYKNTV